MVLLRAVFHLSLLLFVFSSCDDPQSKHADLVFFNAKITTINDDQPNAEALAVKGDTIQFVGSNAEVKKLVGENTEVIDLDGKFVMPGFIESHAHFMGLGNSMMILDLSSASNWDEIIAQVAAASEKVQPGEWIIGRGWHQEKWDPLPNPNIEGYPIHTILSQAVAFNPVLLTHASGHAIFVNRKAMEIAGIDTSSSDPEGGRIVRDSLKNAIGVFEENAADIIYQKYNEYIASKSQIEKKSLAKQKINLAVDLCIKNGITSFHDAGASFETIDLYKEMADSGSLDVRLNVMIGETNEELEKKLGNYKIIGYGKDFLNVRSIKVFIDGALGSRTAWMLDEYDDLPGHTGINVTPLSSLRKTARLAFENGFQTCAHAIGDKGNREILKIYESIINKSSDKSDLRWRVEHAQHLTDRDVEKFRELGVIAAMQGIHATSDAVYVNKRLGSYRAKTGSYVWRKLIDAGVLICNGTDAPVESINHIDNFYATVTRKLSDGREFFPEQSMTRMEALKSMTINGAYASFQDDKLGSLEQGKKADIIVLSNDLLNVSEEKIKNTSVLITMVGGKIVYQK